MSLTPAKLPRLSDKHAAQEQEARKEGAAAPVLRALKKAVTRAKKKS
jgi:hypothetical protein